MGARKKAHSIDANTSPITQLEARCHHAHDADEWRRSERFATAEEKEYTAHLAFSTATISLWAVAHMRVRMYVPRPSVQVASGSRKGWCQMDSATTGHRAMVLMGLS